MDVLTFRLVTAAVEYGKGKLLLHVADFFIVIFIVSSAFATQQIKWTTEFVFFVLQSYSAAKLCQFL